MKIFKLENHTITFDPEILLIPEFQILYKRDKTKTKEQSFSEFEYIYFVTDWNSPYRAYTDILERKEKVKKDYIKIPKWKEDEAIQNALKKYEELSRTPMMGLLEDTNHLIEVLRAYCRQATIDSIDPEKAAKVLEKLPKFVESNKKLEEMVAKEKVENSKVRGNKTVAYDDK